MLKYQHIQPGTHIRAYDFIPCPGRGECYIEGEVVGHFTRGWGPWFLEVKVTRRVWAGEPCKTDEMGPADIRVPMEMDGDAEDDFQRIAGINRIQVIS